MEPAPILDSQVQQSPVPHSWRIIALGAIILVLLVASIGIYFSKYHGFFNALPKNAQVGLVLGIVPAGNSFMLEQDKTLVSVASPRPEMQVMGRVGNGDTTYYLLGDPSTLTSNIYRDVEGTLTQITDSPTLKFDLTFDSASGTFAYLSSVAASTTLEAFVTAPVHLSVFTEAVGERTLPGTGHMLALLSGGGHLLIGNEGAIELVDVETGTRVPLLTLQDNSPFAVSEDGTVLALFNAVTNAIDYFSLSGASASYDRSERVAGVPRALVFAGKKLVMAASTGDRSKIQVSIVGGVSLEVLNPAVPSAPQKLIITYE